MTRPAHMPGNKVAAQLPRALFGMPRLVCAQRWGPWTRAAGMVVAKSAATAKAVEENGGTFLFQFQFAKNALRTTQRSTICVVSSPMYDASPMIDRI